MDTTNNTAGYKVLPKTANLNAVDWIALILMVIGSINWGLVGAFDMDLVATLFGEGSGASRAVYILVGLAGLYGIVLLAKLARRD